MLSETESVNLFEILNKNKIVPIAVFADLKGALKTAEILLQNSINLLEITLRTEIALKCITEISKKFPELFIGSGSVLTENALLKAVDSGAKFAVSPGLDLKLVDFAFTRKIPIVPGVLTPTELNTALQKDLKFIKIFPAMSSGGPEYIKAITAPFGIRDFYLIPTGGINEGNIGEYLKADRVIACGASYIVDSRLIEKGDFKEMSARIQNTRKHLNLI